MTTVTRPDRPEFACVDLFCGCGGNSWGMLRGGDARSLTPLLALDVNATALSTYHRNMPGVTTMLADIRTVTPRRLLSSVGLRAGELGCLVASPPCQTYSRNNRQPKDANDHRNTLYTHTLTIIEGVKPWVVFMENVPEMATVNGGAYHRDFISRLAQLGYTVGHWTVDTASYGVPQRRSRLIYLAYRSRMRATPELPRETHGEGRGLLPTVTVSDAIADLPERGAGDPRDSFVADASPTESLSAYALASRKGLSKGGAVHNHSARDLNEVQLRRLQALGEGQAYYDLPIELRPLKGYNGSYGRLWRAKPAPTLTAHLAYPSCGRFSHYEQNRVITIREALRLQSFDDAFAVDGILIEQSAQVGNAVPPLLASAFKEVIVSALEKHFAGKGSRRRASNTNANGADSITPVALNIESETATEASTQNWGVDTRV